MSDLFVDPVAARLAAGEKIRLGVDYDDGPCLAPAASPQSQLYAKANPFKKGADFNLTEQFRLWRESPELAAALKAAAGV